MQLIIAEKKDLADEIIRALPGKKIHEKYHVICDNYIVCWASGHLLRYKNPNEMNEKYKDWRLEDLPIYFPKWDKIEIEDKKHLLYTILKLLKDSRITEVINAGDPDEEGQYLIDEILEYADNKKPVKRLLINDGTIEAVKKAISQIDDNKNYVNLGKSAQARSISDMIIGFNLSRFYSINSKIKLTIGRVQTPTLALVVNRDEEIKNHIKEKYYELYFKTNILNSELNLKNVLSEKIINKEEYSWIEKIDKRNVKIEIVKKKSFKENPLPYDLGTLQATAETLYKYSSQRTLDITQSLRDKYKAITYNRSEIKYLSDEHYKEAPALVEYVSNKLNITANFNLSEKPKCFNPTKLKGNPHHGIIPTLQGFEINHLSEEEKNIYMLIAERYLIQFLPKIQIEKTEAKANIEEETFKQSSTRIIELGYTKYFKEINEDEAEEENNLSKLSEGVYDVSIIKDDFYIEEKETKPKKHYTEASLLFDMRNIAKYITTPEIKEILKRKDKGKDGINGSIGTSATQAGIINSLFEKGYLIKNGRNIKATDLAIEYLKILPESLKVADTTALWWSIQQEIVEGKAEIEDLTNSVLEDVKKIINSSENIKISSKIANQNNNKERENFGTCPKCKKGKVYASEKNFYCSEYKNGCKFSLFKKMKIYGQKEIDITETRAKTLLANQSILITKVPSKTGKEYDAYFKLEIGDKYNNLVFDKFKDTKKK